jgi:hypothetical protein
MISHTIILPPADPGDPTEVTFRFTADLSVRFPGPITFPDALQPTLHADILAILAQAGITPVQASTQPAGYLPCSQ